MSFSNFINSHQNRVTRYLSEILPSEELEPFILHKSMRYSVLNGGKRIRPLLMYAIAETFQSDTNLIDPIAAAVEMIHCYSLIHDDLPAMDNDDLRRGLPTCHKAFDEATAILAGDALQAFAFEILAVKLNSKMDASKIVEMILCLSKACGSLGMAGGQALDIAATGRGSKISSDYVERMHSKKTGALISASVDLAAIASHCSKADRAILSEYGILLGLAFQIQDDILDIESSTEMLGKQQGADLIADKLTYPSVVGLVSAKGKVDELYGKASQSIEDLSFSATRLEELGRFMLNRDS